MSLKAFHLLFVTALSSLAFGCAVWKFKVYADQHATNDLLLGIAAVLGGVAVIIYGGYFLKKLRNISFL